MHAERPWRIGRQKKGPGWQRGCKPAHPKGKEGLTFGNEATAERRMGEEGRANCRET